jgi:hypothetical protein
LESEIAGFIAMFERPSAWPDLTVFGWIGVGEGDGGDEEEDGVFHWILSYDSSEITT